jgi:hypothetical protein
MRAFPEVLHNQRHGVFILGLCVTLHVPDCAVAAAEAAAMDAAVAALRRLATDSGLSANACILFARLSEQWSSLREKGVHIPAAPTSDAIAAILTVLRTHTGSAEVLEAAAYALARLCDIAAGSQTGFQDAVAPLCAALRTHTDAAAVGMQRWVLQALSKILVDAPAAVAAVSAGPAGIGTVIELLIRSTPAQNPAVLKFGCVVLMAVACCAEAKLSSTDAVGPLVHVLEVHGSHQDLGIGFTACTSLLNVIQSSRQHTAEAVKLFTGAAVPDAVFAAYPDLVADLFSLLKTEAEAQADAQAQAQALALAEAGALMQALAPAQAQARSQAQAQAQAQADVQAQAQAQARAREEATRRADAIAAELIAEEEEAARAAAAPPARKSRKKRGGGGGAAGGQRAEPASSEPPADLTAAPDFAAASAAALSELALSDAAGAAGTPSAAAARRRRRAATKAARRRAGSAAAQASGGGAASRGDEPASEAEDDAADAEADTADAEAAAVVSAEAVRPPDAASAATAAASLPPLPAPTVPAATKECCVCLSDLPAAELLAVVPCGHHCLCADCWESLGPPAARRCPICNAPAAMAMRVFF